MSGSTYIMVDSFFNVFASNAQQGSSHRMMPDNSMTDNFSATIIRDDGKFVAQCNEITHIYGQGDSEEKALIDLMYGISDELGIAIDKINLSRNIIYED